MPVDREKQKITYHFHRGHLALDLRTYDFKNEKLQNCILTEDAILLRRGIDDLGNDFAVFEPLETDYNEIKYIHVGFPDYINESKIGKTFWKNTFLGVTKIRQEIGRGNSLSHHLHFVTVLDYKPVNPLDYFDLLNIKWEI